MKLFSHRSQLHRAVTWGDAGGCPSPTPHSDGGWKQKPRAGWHQGKHQRHFAAPRFWVSVAQDISRADVISLFSNLEYISTQVLLLSSVCISFKYSQRPLGRNSMSLLHAGGITTLFCLFCSAFPMPRFSYGKSQSIINLFSAFSVGEHVVC